MALIGEWPSCSKCSLHHALLVRQDWINSLALCMIDLGIPPALVVRAIAPLPSVWMVA